MDIDTLIKKAKRAAFEWRNKSYEERAEYLMRFLELLDKDAEDFAIAISLETGKLLWESRQEVAAMKGKVAISIQAQKERCPTLSKELPQGKSITRHKPLGTLLVLGPFNFPGHLPNGHIVPALLAGNSILFKPSELATAVGKRLIALWHRAGIPQELLCLIEGDAKVGAALVHHPDIDGVLFTGSYATGKKISEYMGSHPGKLLALEMGGNNPLVISDFERPEAAAYLTLLSAYLTAGQRCTCARRLIVTKRALDKGFLESLLQIICNVQVGSWQRENEPFMGPVISQGAAEMLLEAQQSLIEMGATSLIAMRRLSDELPLLSPGLLDVTEIAALPDKEYFGPLLQLIRVNDLQEAIETANRTEYGLISAIVTPKREEYETFYEACRAGLINWNVQTTGASSAAPFGGVGKSGNFRPSGSYAADYCNYPVASFEQAKLTLPEKTAPGIALHK